MNSFSSPLVNRPQQVDLFGDGTCDSGMISSLSCKTPGGVSGHFFGNGSDADYINQLSSPQVGWQYGAPGYTQLISNFFGTKFPATIPGAKSSVPFFSANYYRGEGPVAFTAFTNLRQTGVDAWTVDAATKSTFSGTIGACGGSASAVLTLSANAIGSMWEGEVLSGSGLTQGVYITGLCTTALCGADSPAGWGLNASTYALAGASGVSFTGALSNAVYYSGGGPSIYAGPLNDVYVPGMAALANTTSYFPHTGGTSAFGVRRIAARWAAEAYGGLSNTAGAPNPPNASTPSLSRASQTACGSKPSPCFDTTGSLYRRRDADRRERQRAHVQRPLGARAPHRHGADGLLRRLRDRVRRLGDLQSADAIDRRRPGADRRGQQWLDRHRERLGDIGLDQRGRHLRLRDGRLHRHRHPAEHDQRDLRRPPGRSTPAARTTSTARPPTTPPRPASASGSGIGSLVRGFRIGTNQTMYTFTTGSVFDDGIDLMGGAFHMNQAFTCNIVAAAMIQCVKGSGAWTPGSTFVSYGDAIVSTGRAASLLGYVGGQSYPDHHPRLRLLGPDRDARLRHGGERRLSAEGRHQNVGRRDHRRFPILEHDAERADGAWRARPVHGFADRRLGGQHPEHRGRASRRRRRRRHRHHRQQHDGHVRLRQFRRARKPAQPVLHRRHGRLLGAGPAAPPVRRVPGRGGRGLGAGPA